MVIYLEKLIGATDLDDIGLMKSGRVQWQKAEETRKYFNIVLIHQGNECFTLLTRQDNKFFISELFKVIQDAISLILHYWTMCQFRTISSGTLSLRMCNQFTLHHKFRIDTGKTKFEQVKTDSILYGCESCETGTQRSV